MLNKYICPLGDVILLLLILSITNILYSYCDTDTYTETRPPYTGTGKPPTGKILLLKLQILFNRPSVARAVLQTQL